MNTEVEPYTPPEKLKILLTTLSVGDVVFFVAPSRWASRTKPVEDDLDWGNGEDFIQHREMLIVKAVVMPPGGFQNQNIFFVEFLNVNTEETRLIVFNRDKIEFEMFSDMAKGFKFHVHQNHPELL